MFMPPAIGGAGHRDICAVTFHIEARLFDALGRALVRNMRRAPQAAESSSHPAAHGAAEPVRKATDGNYYTKQEFHVNF